MVAEVVLNDALFGGLMAATTATILALFGWVLTQAVTLGRVVSRLEAQTEDHERRLLAVETVVNHPTP